MTSRCARRDIGSRALHRATKRLDERRPGRGIFRILRRDGVSTRGSRDGYCRHGKPAVTVFKKSPQLIGRAWTFPGRAFFVLLPIPTGGRLFPVPGAASAANIPGGGGMSHPHWSGYRRLIRRIKPGDRAQWRYKRTNPPAAPTPRRVNKRALRPPRRSYKAPQFPRH
jgi:hypothetical protein